MNQIIKQSFNVHFDYSVVFTRGMWEVGNQVVEDTLREAVAAHPNPRMLIYMDAGVVSAMPDLPANVTRKLHDSIGKISLAAPPIFVPGGEVCKSDSGYFEQMLKEMAEAKLDRHSFVMAIGGGAVLDAVGYAASLIHRGVRMIRVPTTVLAQNDGGVGVKTAINDAAGKNFFGTFAPPFAVINDFNFLDTLPDEEWRSGIAEAFKVAMIKDAGFFQWLTRAAPRLAARNTKAMEKLITRCARLHLKHIRSTGDPFELGQARPLDFGHWSAHELEAMTNYSLGHGHAVAIGIMIDTLYAGHYQWVSRNVADQLFLGLSRSGFRMWHDALELRNQHGRLEVLTGLSRFREHLGGELCITMPLDGGKSMEVSEIDDNVMAKVMGELRARVHAEHA